MEREAAVCFDRAQPLAHGSPEILARFRGAKTGLHPLGSSPAVGVLAKVDRMAIRDATKAFAAMNLFSA